MNDQTQLFLTPAVLARFLEYADDAVNWDGTPPVGCNVGGDAADTGYLINMKKAGLLDTDYEPDDGLSWIYFTAKGRELAAANGIDLS